MSHTNISSNIHFVFELILRMLLNFIKYHFYKRVQSKLYQIHAGSANVAPSAVRFYRKYFNTAMLVCKMLIVLEYSFVICYYYSNIRRKKFLRTKTED